jgi:hypothetical protein
MGPQRDDLRDLGGAFPLVFVPVPTIVEPEAHRSGNPMNLAELNTEQRRQLVDARQVYEAYTQAKVLWQHSYIGSMRWVKRKGVDYLHWKRGKRERSLGRRSPQTETTFAAFVAGRAELKQRTSALVTRLDRMAPVNRALGLGRMPMIAAKIVRMLADESLLGSQLLVVGTNALYAYEARAGVVLASDLLATGDADLLWDARQRMSLVSSTVRRGGIIGLLQKVDRSFQQRRSGDFRAVNRDGYYVDLIRPEDRDAMRPDRRTTIGERRDDLHPAPIFGLHWLVNAPRLETVSIASDGYPVSLVVPDPRAFSLHKLWLSGRRERDPIKRPRDREQARSVATICLRYLHLEFEDAELRSLPRRLRALIAELPRAASASDEPPEPAW